MKKKPVFSWPMIILHYVAALCISWLGVAIMQTNPALERLAQPLLLKASILISSIGGYAAISPYPDQVRLYLLLCWLGVPVHFIFAWRISAYVYPEWVKSQNALRFWFLMFGGVAGLFTLWWLPSEAYALRTISQGYSDKSSRLLQLAKDNFIFFSILGYITTYAFSLMAGICAQAIRIRLFLDINKR